jgi:hypothetical protein
MIVRGLQNLGSTSTNAWLTLCIQVVLNLESFCMPLDQEVWNFCLFSFFCFSPCFSLSISIYLHPPPTPFPSLSFSPSSSDPQTRTNTHKQIPNVSLPPLPLFRRCPRVHCCSLPHSLSHSVTYSHHSSKLLIVLRISLPQDRCVARISGFLWFRSHDHSIKIQQRSVMISSLDQWPRGWLGKEWKPKMWQQVNWY